MALETARSTMDPAAAGGPAVAELARVARHRRLGIALLASSAGLLTAGDAIAKWLSATYPIGEIIFVRGLIVLALLVLWCLPRGRLPDLLPRRLAGQLARALSFVAATFLMIWSLSLLPLATVTAITFAAPIITTAIAPWLLGESVGWRRWLAVLAGFAGVLLIVSPFGGHWSWALLVPLGAAAAQSLRDIATRHLVGTETTASVVFVTMTASVIVGALTAPLGLIDPQAWRWTMPSAWDAVLLVCFGMATCAAYLMQVAALRAAEAVFLAPFKYVTILWAIAIGFAVWGHVPGAAVLVGSLIIIGSGMFIWWRETGMRPLHA
ncbi:MAG: DMT family transporter [Xanthobacteraceae bacterium]|nr:DMT family transporter [Xanthobacteraceae bacterium]